ncbi:MAG: carboxypeptidase-like regulatory domain-containing protein [Candidatus Latescibacterota bacterium]
MDGASARGVRLQGRATDAATSEPLALATVQVIGTFTGTIANDEGFFVLEVPELQVTLRVTYIGYASRERTIADSAATLGIDFRLPVTPYRLPEMIVRPDEARLIMAEVIRRKAQWRPRIQLAQRGPHAHDDSEGGEHHRHRRGGVRGHLAARGWLPGSGGITAPDGKPR